MPPPSASSSGRRRVAALVAAVIVSTPALIAAQAAASSAPRAQDLTVLDRLIGRWQGTTEGQPGSGTVEREYDRVLADRFIRVRNRSTYPPQPRNSKGEVHEDLGFFSLDKTRKAIVFRQFHAEGFVNQYVVDASTTETRLVMTTEAIENIPPGWRARETYVIGDDRLEETFELAGPGQPFTVYSKNTLTRSR